MKAILLGFLLTVCIGIKATAAPVLLDLSSSHTIEDLNHSGLQITKIGGGLHGQAYSFQNQEVEIRLPAGRSIAQNIVLGTIDTKDSKLTDLMMYGEIMPHDQALQVAQKFLESFGLDLNHLNQWEAKNRGKIRDGEPYSISANLKYYPRIGIGFKPSMNGLYPWVVSLSLSWEWDKQRDWNEERVWREMPAPATGAVSLNPPSGVKYERRDAYKGLGEEADKQKLPPQWQPDPHSCREHLCHPKPRPNRQRERQLPNARTQANLGRGASPASFF